MRKINYIREMNSFYHFCISKKLSKSEAALLHALYMINNAQHWDVWFEADNELIGRLTGGYGRDAVLEARNKLKQKGRIDFKPGKRNTAPPRYKIIPFDEEGDFFQNDRLKTGIKGDKEADIEQGLLLKQKKKEIKNHEEDLCKKVVDYLNIRGESAYRHSTAATRRLICARAKEGYLLDDFCHVIDVKTVQWKEDGVMRRYLRPETLFGSKFESYLQEWAREPEKYNAFSREEDNYDFDEIEFKGRQLLEGVDF